MKTNELREKYLSFFQSKGHTLCSSDVLVPTWDPTVLFTPAGMNQFKDHFLGKVKLDFTRATSCQKCLRTGDIDNVGRTAYHHTFFEMLGNFSFGDYFKKDAIHWAWEFLTDKNWLGIDPDRLTVTVYLEDDEAAEIWHQDIGLTLDRIERMGEHDNFWPAGAPSDGPDGVCGPCSEIFFHPEKGKEVEIWNLVFTQFNRVGNPPDNLRPLPSKNIDTGMGLERAAATLQGVSTNYHIDILLPIVEAAGEICGVGYDAESENGRRLRRITDHMRACSMAIHENVYPGPNKEKYVIRRLLRRAVLDGHQMGLREPFLYKLVPTVVEQMRAPYPEIAETVKRVQDVIQNEEANFFGTIDAGLARIEKIFGDMHAQNRTTVLGAEAADLYQTYGVPAEVFESMAAEQRLAFDWDGFRAAMVEHGEISGKLSEGVMDSRGPVDTIKKALHATEFLGYEQSSIDTALKFIISEGQLVDAFSATGESSPVILVLEKTPFYGESGGQVGDAGMISGDSLEFVVTDTQKDGSVYLHHGYLKSGSATTGAKVTASIDKARREAVRRAHSATHVLHHALQKNLGTHAQQQGSKVDVDWLRFDFTNMSAVNPEELAAIERDVLNEVAASQPIRWEVLPLAEARAAGAMMLFGEKYPERVRMVSMGEFSKELCGGTHLDNTASVGAFEIIAEEGVSAGTRRLVALTGERAGEHQRHTTAELERVAKLLDLDPVQVATAASRLLGRVRDLKKQVSSGLAKSTDQPQAKPSQTNPTQAKPISGRTEQPAYQELKGALKETARLLNVPLFEVASRIEGLLAEVCDLERQLAELTSHGELSADALLTTAVTIGKTSVVVASVPGGNVNLMRQLIDQIRKKVDSSAVMFAAGQGADKVTLVAGVSRDLVDQGVSAGNWVKQVSPAVDGGGGGKPDMAQAGGKSPEKIPAALEVALQTIRAMIEA